MDNQNLSAALPRLVQINFCVPTANAVPLVIYGRAPRPKPQGESNKGKLAFHNKESKTTAVPLLGDLVEYGYELVAVTHKERPQPKNGREPGHVVSFTFVPREFVTTPKKYSQQDADDFMQELGELCRRNFWAAEGYQNSFLNEKGEQTDEVFFSVNLTGRSPLFEENGEPILEFPRDADGKKRLDLAQNDPRWAKQPRKPRAQIRMDAEHGVDTYSSNHN
jgi:hypothetical protein